jgi:hypothetical protein
MSERWLRHLSIVMLAAATVGASAQEDSSRSIVPEAFLQARPPAPAAPKGGQTYHRVSPRPSAAPGAKAQIAEIGLTIWKLRPAKQGDVARLLVQEPQSPSVVWTPERVELGTPLAIGDRVRISIESPRAGHLYVVDRERYADGSTGEPYLIFPTTRTRGGDDRVVGGRLIEIPAQTDSPPFFTLQASRSDQVSELLTVIVAAEPLSGVTPTIEPLKLPRATIAAWKQRGGTTVDRLEMNGGAGRAWSIEEQRAGADTTRLLTQQDPPPQTVFRIVTTEPGFMVAEFSLSHARTRDPADRQSPR